MFGGVVIFVIVLVKIGGQDIYHILCDVAVELGKNYPDELESVKGKSHIKFLFSSTFENSILLT